jgi:outer membrane receptor protein involved in Fe transport
MFKKTKVCTGVLVALSGGLALSGASAFAQTAERVEITGSRIRSISDTSLAPLQVFNAQDIAASGVVNIQELLLKSPVMGEPGISRTNSNFATSSAGVSTIDLRNLGTARTLVLINGRRVVSGVPGDMSVDLNTIPTAFVERVEVLTGGSSAVYGSDAVAGVVNIILKKNFEGVAIDAQVGQSSRGDDKGGQFNLTFGTSGPKGSLMGHFGYSHQGAVYSRDRDFAAVDQYSEGAGFTGDPATVFKPVRPFYSSYAPQGRFFTDGEEAPSSITFDRNGNVIPWSTNGSSTLAATGFNRSEFRTIAVPTDRYLFASKGEYQLSENHSAYFEGTYAFTKTTSRLEPFPLGAEDIYPATGGQVPAEFLVNGVLQRNPMVPDIIYNTAIDTNGDGLRDYYFTRRLAEVGNRGNTADRDTFRIVSGLKGILFSNWDYDLYGAFGATKESQVSSGQVNVLNFRNALEAVPDVNDINGNGNTTEGICLDANARAQGCVPINIFGYNTITPAALQYVTAPGLLSTYTQQNLFGGVITGEPISLPAGKLGVAVGFEYRHEFARSEFDPLQQAGLNAGNAIPRTAGGFDVKELFTEVKVPLLKDLPAVKMLNLTAAVRGSDYSTVGSTLSWNTGVEWAPTSDLRVRATRSKSTRAPNINELYSPPSQDFPTGLSDPCVGVTAVSTGPNDNACRAAPGVMDNINANGSFTLNQSDLQGVSGFNRGNPKLQEEDGKSWTIGLVFAPTSISFLKNTSFSLDYFNITVDQAIVSTPRQFILDQCYAGNASFCSFITRRPTAVGANSAGSLEFIDSAVTNSGGLATKGFDLAVNYADKVGPGRLGVRAKYTRLIDGYTIPLPGADKDYFAGEVGAAKDRLGLTLSYAMGDWSFTSQTTYIGKSSLDDQFLKSTFDLPRDAIQVPSKTYNDFQVSYAFNKTSSVYVGIDNAFDVKPAPVISGLPGNDTGTETNAGTYDPIGRRWYAGVRLRF